MLTNQPATTTNICGIEQFQYLKPSLPFLGIRANLLYSKFQQASIGRLDVGLQDTRIVAAPRPLPCQQHKDLLAGFMNP
jgi:hypothetical protein